MTAWIVVALIRVALGCLPFPRTLRLAAFLGRTRRAERPGGPTPAEFAWAVNAASRYVPRVTCLARALALNALLSRWGQTSQIKIGVAKDTDGGLKSHAWVECDGRIILGALENIGDFSTLVSLDRASRLLEHECSP